MSCCQFSGILTEITFIIIQYEIFGKKGMGECDSFYLFFFKFNQFSVNELVHSPEGPLWVIISQS